MAINLGRPRPSLLERFMTPGEEGMIKEMFLQILGDKKNGL